MTDSDAQVVAVGPRNFQIRGTLGKGGFSVVYAGMDQETGKRVALKMMFNVKEDDISYKQTCDEIKMMRKLSHPNLIKLLGYDLHAKYNGEPCVILVQELAPNRELFEYLLHSETTFSEQLVMYIMQSVFGAVDYMHKQGIAHRDLKPENILLDREFRLKIADFGFAKHFIKKEQAVTMRTELGTRGYMAPEIGSHATNADGSKGRRLHYDQKVDSFALGVIMFICSAGFPPFRTTTSEDWWFDKIMKRQWEYFWKAHERKATLSPLCKDLLEKMLAANTDDRQTVADCLKHEFFHKNPAGRMLTKEDYKVIMKKRYSIVKQKVKKIKDGQTDGHGKRDVQKKVKAFAEYQDSFVPCKELCMNDVRSEIFRAAESSGFEAMVAKVVAEKVFPNADPKAYHSIYDELLQFYKAQDKQYVREAFGNAENAKDLATILPGNMADKADKLLRILNECELGNDIAATMNAGLEFMKHEESADMSVMDPERLEDSLGMYHVRFGLGGFAHMMKQLAFSPDAPEVHVDFANTRALVKYTLQENLELGDEEVTITDTMEVELKMHKLVPTNGSKFPGCGLSIQPASTSQGFLQNFTACKDRILETTKILRWEYPANGTLELLAKLRAQ